MDGFACRHVQIDCVCFRRHGMKSKRAFQQQEEDDEGEE